MDQQKVVKLPDGWSRLSLGALGELYCGQSVSLAEVNTKQNGVPYFTGPEQWDGDELHIDKWTDQPKRLAPEGCIFVTVKGAGVGKIFPGAAGAIGRDIYAFHVHPHLNFKYVFYALKFSIDQIIMQAQGDIPGLSKSHILEHEIGIPGFHEQGRIVAKIEALFSELGKGIEALKTAREQLKVYRQAVLKHAFEGRLTAQWREENKDRLESSEQLLARIQQEREARYQDLLRDWKVAAKAWEENGKEGRKPVKPSKPTVNRITPDNDMTLPAEWACIELGSLAVEVVLGKMLDKVKNVGSFRPYLGNINVRWGGFDISNLKLMKIEDAEVDRYGIREGDLVVCEGGEPGRCAVWKGADKDVFIQKALHRVRFPDSYDPYFAYYYIVYAAKTHRIAKHFTGTTIKHLTGAGLKNIQFPVCLLAEQKEIVKKLEEALSVVEEQESEINAALHRAETLRQSILKKAFSGQLVAQDPNDEPASVLLERIRAEKAQQTQPARRTRRKQTA